MVPEQNSQSAAAFLSFDEKKRQIEQPISLTPDPVNDNKLVTFFLKQVPLLNTLSKTIQKLGLTADKLGFILEITKGRPQITKLFQITASFLAGIDFFTIPAAYIGCRMLGVPFPYSFSNGAKFVYNGILFGLSLSVLIFPAAALPIAITIASLSVVAAAASLVKHGWSLYKLNTRLTETQSGIEILIKEIKTIQKAAAIETDESVLDELYDKYQATSAKLQRFVNQKEELEKEKALFSNLHLVDKLVGLGLAFAGLAGLAIAVVAPPIGIAILYFAAATAVAYLGLRIGQLIWSKKTAKTAQEMSKSSESLPPADRIQHESTLDIAKLLEDNPIQSLNNLQEEMHELSEKAEHLTNMINHIILTQDAQTALVFMHKMGEELSNANYTLRDMQQFLNELPRFKEALPIFESALDKIITQEIHPDAESLAILNQVEPFRLYLERKTPTLEELLPEDLEEMPEFSQGPAASKTTPSE